MGKAATMTMLYVLHGNDDFSLREEMQRIKAGLGESDSLASNTTVFDGQRVGVNQLTDACVAMPFLGEHRLVVVEGLLSRFEKRDRNRGRSGEGAEPASKKKAGLGEWSALAERVRGMPPTTVLILVDGEIRKDNILLKELAPLAEVKAFAGPRGDTLQRWIQHRVAEKGSTISPQASRLLASFVGENLWVLFSEIEKLALFTAGRGIDVEDVETLVSHAREASVFAMVDALIERRAGAAATLLHQLLDDGAAPPFLLSMVTRQLRMLVQVRELKRDGASTAQIKATLGVRSDYALTKAVEQAGHYSTARLEEVYGRLLETDLSIKRGMWKGDVALDLLIAGLCA